MLGGAFKEGHDLSIGRAKVLLPKDDSDVFEMLLQIAHNRTGDFQCYITVVDKYQMVKAIHFFTRYVVISICHR